MRARPLASLAALVVLGGVGCTRDEPQLSEEQQRTMEKLRGEVDRETAAREDPNANLARFAAGEKGAAEGERKLPANDAPIQTGPIKLSLSSVHIAHQVSGGKLSVASEDWFLRVTLHVENTSKASVPVNFSLVRLLSGETVLPRAGDAQRLAGTRELDRRVAPGTAEPVILFFEVPDDALGKPNGPLTLHFPPSFAGAPDARLPIE